MQDLPRVGVFAMANAAPDTTKCERCEGSGKQSDGATCDRCKGSGIRQRVFPPAKPGKDNFMRPDEASQIKGPDEDL